MLTLEIVGLCALVALFIVAFLFRKHPIYGKFYKYSFALIPLIIMLIVKIFLDSKNDRTISNDAKAGDTLRNGADTIKGNISDAQNQASNNVAAAQAKVEDAKKPVAGAASDVDAYNKRNQDIANAKDQAEKAKKIADSIG
jgi:hypothetical protein